MRDRSSTASGSALQRLAGGFTLLELMVVLAIVAAVAVFAFPSFSPGPGVQLKAATRAVVVGLRKARSEAVTANDSRSMVFNLKERHFVVGAKGRVQRLPENVGLSLFTARRERVSRSVAGIRFFPDGSSTGGRVTLESGGREVFIDIDWLTGRVRLLDPSDAES